MKKVLASLLALIILCAALALPASAYSATVRDGDVMQFGDFNLVSGHVVFYPAALESEDGKWPVVVWANGTVCPPVLYTELLEGIANNGYVVVASSNVMSADGKDQCNSIDYIFGLGNDPDSQFYNKIDTTRVAAAGHSQGGRSSVNAAQRDDRIGCVVSIAGSNVKGEADGLKTPTFFITGTADLVVLSSLWVKPAYKKARGPAVYASIKGGIHTTSMIAPDYVQKYTVKWLDAVLNGDEDALAAFTVGGELSRDKAWKDYTSKNLGSLSTGAVLSTGSVIVIAVIAGAAILGTALLIVVNKAKKKAVAAEGDSDSDNTEE